MGIFLTPGRDGALARLARARLPACGRSWARRRSAARSASASWRRATRRRAAPTSTCARPTGRAVAFLYGWKCLLVMDPGLTAALATGPRRLRRGGRCPASSPKAVALAAIAAIAAANVLGVRLATAIGHGLALAKIALLARPRGVGLRAPAPATRRTSSRSSTRRPGAPPARPALAGRPRARLLLVRRLVGGGEARRRGARPAAHAAARPRPRGGRGDAPLRVGERRLPLPRPDRAGRLAARPSPPRPASPSSGPSGGRALSALVVALRAREPLRLHDLRPAPLLRDGARRRGPGLRRPPRPADRGAGRARSPSRPRSPPSSWRSAPSRRSSPTSSS